MLFTLKKKEKYDKLKQVHFVLTQLNIGAFYCQHLKSYMWYPICTIFLKDIQYISEVGQICIMKKLYLNNLQFMTNLVRNISIKEF